MTYQHYSCLVAQRLVAAGGSVPSATLTVNAQTVPLAPRRKTIGYRDSQRLCDRETKNSIRGTADHWVILEDVAGIQHRLPTLGFRQVGIEGRCMLSVAPA